MLLWLLGLFIWRHPQIPEALYYDKNTLTFKMFYANIINSMGRGRSGDAKWAALHKMLAPFWGDTILWYQSSKKENNNIFKIIGDI